MKALVAFLVLSFSTQLFAEQSFSMLQAVNIKMKRIQALTTETKTNPVQEMAAAKEIGERNAEEIILMGRANNQSYAEIRLFIISEIQKIEDDIDAVKGDKAGEIMAQSEILGHLELLEYVETHLEGAEILRESSTAKANKK